MIKKGKEVIVCSIDIDSDKKQYNSYKDSTVTLLNRDTGVFVVEGKTNDHEYTEEYDYSSEQVTDIYPVDKVYNIHIIHD